MGLYPWHNQDRERLKMADTTSKTPSSDDAIAALEDAFTKGIELHKTNPGAQTEVPSDITSAFTAALKIYNDAAGIGDEAKTDPADFYSIWIQAGIRIGAKFFKK